VSDRTENETRKPRRLSGNDAIYLYGESETMPMHTMGTMIVDASPHPDFDFDHVVATIRSRIHQMPPFRQRLLEIPFDLGNPILVDDPDFCVENHLRRIGVPEPGGLRELGEVVGMLAERPLERTKPLWEMWYVDGMQDGRIALVTKLHHCVMDGASGSAQMAGLLDLEPDAEAPQPTEEWDPKPLPSVLELASSSAFERVVSPQRAAGVLFDTAKGVLARMRAEQEIDERGESRVGWMAPRTPLNRSITQHRSVAYGSVLLDDIKRVKRAFGVTVNDAILAAYSLALRQYLLERDGLPDVPLHCSIPVSLKSDDERQDFSNKVTGTTIELPTQIEDPAEVVEAIHLATKNAKAVLDAVEGEIIPQWLEMVPGSIAELLMTAVKNLKVADLMPLPFNVILSNIMGPPIPLYVGGARVEAVFPMGPVAEGMGLNVTVLSNMGRLDIGVQTCTEVVPDPWEITRAFSQAVGELLLAAEKREAADD
jgi:WS/DGAT/MGAT family acyltransferase